MIGGTCKTCKFYSPGSHYDCHENIDELVVDKDRPNFCEYYQKNTEAFDRIEEEKKEKAKQAEAAFEAFFGNCQI